MPFLILLYNIFAVPLFFIGIKIAGLFHEKTRNTAIGRRKLFPQLSQDLKKLEGKKKIWLHISSMGEYEQGKPIVDELLKRFPEFGIVVSVFSPSGYNNIKLDHPNVIVTYLPFDYYSHASRFITLIDPLAAIVVRHDFWLNYQYILHRRAIPSFLIDASISDARLHSVKKFWFFFGPIYRTFTAIFTVSVSQKERFQQLLPDIYADNTGDTRYDRVYARAMETEKIAALQKNGGFIAEKCMVLGSTWPSGEKIILPPLVQVLQRDPEFKLIIAPHETTVNHLEQIESFFQDKSFPLVRFANFNEWNSSSRILLIDRIGLLANLYALGKIAYVGGGFGPGVHNVLEPAAHGAVVFYGPRHLNSPEAEMMSQQSIGCPFENSFDFLAILDKLLADNQILTDQSQSTLDFVMQHIGASQKTIQIIADKAGL